MPPVPRTPFVTALLAALGLSACTAPPASLDAGATARLDQLRHAPNVAGARVYRGTVFAAGDSDGTPALFHYERRILATMPDGIIASHITRNTQGEVLIEEAAEVSPAYTLRHFHMVNRQLASSGSAVVSADGRSVAFTVRRDGVEQTGGEDITDPLVTGPSLHGFVLRQWTTLAAGATVPVRMLVLADMRSYGFEIRQAGQTDQHTTFAITPSSWLVRLAVAPLTVRFDTVTRHVVRYEGRVPPMREMGGKMQVFDARVEYSDHASSYR